MNIYYRFFRILDAETVTKLNDLFDQRISYREKLQKLEDQLGAIDLYVKTRTGILAGFGFDQAPDSKKFKKVDAGYMPKLSTKFGKEFYASLAEIKVPAEINTALKEKIPTYLFSMMNGLNFYSCSVFGRKNLWFVNVPWADIDPKKLDDYKVGHNGDNNMDHLMWTKPDEWVEVKEWEAKRDIDQANMNESAL